MYEDSVISTFKLQGLKLALSRHSTKYSTKPGIAGCLPDTFTEISRSGLCFM